MEFWDIYDKNRIKTGRKHERGKPLPAGEYHLVVTILIINSRKEILVTKRHPDKPYPNMWECPGGSVLTGEDSLEGALREVKEEIGIDLPNNSGDLVKSEIRNHDFKDVWLFHHDFDIEETVLQPEEVTDAKWVTLTELESMFNEGIVVPSLEKIKKLLVEKLQQDSVAQPEN